MAPRFDASSDARTAVGRALRHALCASALSLAAGCLNVPDDASTDPGAVTVPSTAAEVIARHIEALGGEEKLRAITQRTVEARVTFMPQPGCEDPAQGCIAEETTGQFMLHSTADGRMFRRMVVAKTVSERGYDGKTGWELQGEPRLLVLDDEVTALASREDALLHWYLDYDERGIKPSIEPARTVDSQGERRDLDGITWAAGEGQLPPRQYWFDRMTGLLREEIEADPDGQLRRTVIYEDYQEVDGVKVPHTIRQITELGETRQEIVISVQRVHHGDIRDDMFAVPELEPAKPMPDELALAFEEAKQLAETNAKDPSAVFRYASAAWALGHFEEAAQASRKMLKLVAKDPAALFMLGRAQVLAGDFKAAERTLKQAEKAGARPELVAHHLATIALHRHDFARAAKAFEAAGETALAERYGAFDGKPLAAKWAAGKCSTELPLIADIPVPVVETTIDGETLNLMVDTSAADIILDPERARKLVISTDSMSELGGQGGPPIGHGQADSLTLGDLTLERVPVDIFPAQVLAEMAVDRRVDGILGVRPLLDFQVTVDREANTLTLVRSGGKCKKELASHRDGVEVPFWVYETHIMYVSAQMNGTEGLYLVNTGMRGAALAANDDAFARAGVGAPVLRRGDPGAFVSIDSFRLDPALEVRDAQAAWGYVAANATRDEFRFDGMVGLEVLGRNRLTIDYPKRRFYLTAGAPAEAPKATKAGAKKVDAKPAKKD
jgi:tetratricopeptide (TPR) repeat protein